MRQAVARRDRAFLLETIADDIKVDFGGGRGRADFVRSWALDTSQESGLWSELGRALDLGCARGEEGALWDPSFAWQLTAEEDIYQTLFALPGAVLRAAPEEGSAALATLEWDVVALENDDGADAWLPVRLADGRRGYVVRELMLSAIDYRAVFQRQAGRWRMTAFIAGD